MVDAVVDVAVEGAQGLPKVGWCLGLVGCGEWDEEPVALFV